MELPGAVSRSAWRRGLCAGPCRRRGIRCESRGGGTGTQAGDPVAAVRAVVGAVHTCQCRVGRRLRGTVHNCPEGPTTRRERPAGVRHPVITGGPRLGRKGPSRRSVEPHRHVYPFDVIRTEPVVTETPQPHATAKAGQSLPNGQLGRCAGPPHACPHARPHVRPLGRLSQGPFGGGSGSTP